MDTLQNRDGLTHSAAGRMGYEKSRISLQNIFQSRRKAYYQSPKQCGCCLKTLEYKDRHKTFCNRSCSAKFHNKNNVKTKKCAECGDDIVGYTRSIFCSRECWTKNHKNKSNSDYLSFLTRWKNGEEDGWYGKSYKINPYIRRFFFEKFGDRCQECSWSEINPTTGKVPLQIDHKNGDASDCREENLRLLCPNCHSLTPTFGRLNKTTVRRHR